MEAALAALVLGSVRAAVGSASQEAGKQAWQGLVALIRKARRQPDAVVEPTETEAETLAATLVEAAERDPEFAAELRGWVELVGAIAGGNDNVVNTISEGAHIKGNVIQARDIGGAVTIN